MTAEFNWWLLIVGLVVGAGLTWLVVAETRRREIDLEEAELPVEAAWLATVMADEGEPIRADVAERVLRHHRDYLGIADPETWFDPDDEPGSAGDASAVERDDAEPEPSVRDVD